jgi:nucleotide-binding universal stress UspA family protein
MEKPMNILLAIDDSPPSRDAAQAVLSRPWPAGSVVRVLCVAPVVPPVASRVPPSAGATMSFTPLSVDKDLETKQLLLITYANVALQACEALRARGLHAEARTRYGDAGPEILAEASEWPADVIIVGSHDRSPLKRLFLGSTSKHVVEHAHCSVEVARLPVLEQSGSG